MFDIFKRNQEDKKGLEETTPRT